MHPDAAVKFCASNMVMNIYSYMSYLSKPNACSRACGHFFMGSLPTDGKPIKLNGAFHDALCLVLGFVVLCLVLGFVVASAAKEELEHYS